jgi:hypothetical protein
MVSPNEAVSQAVIGIRFEGRGQVVEGPGFVEEIIFDNAILETRATGVERHLQVLVVNLNVVEGKLDIGEDAQVAGFRSSVFQGNVPQFDIIFDRDEDQLAGLDAPIIAGEFGIREAVTALVPGLIQILASWLPGNAPELTGVIIADVDVMAGPVKRDAILAKTSYSPMLG